MHKRATVLLVAGDPVLRDGLKRVLMAWGYHVVTGKDLCPEPGQQPKLSEGGAEGEDISAVVIDVLNPDREGVAVLHSLRQAGLEIPVLAMRSPDREHSKARVGARGRRKPTEALPN